MKWCIFITQKPHADKHMHAHLHTAILCLRAEKEIEKRKGEVKCVCGHAEHEAWWKLWTERKDWGHFWEQQVKYSFLHVPVKKALHRQEHCSSTSWINAQNYQISAQMWSLTTCFIHIFCLFDVVKHTFKLGEHSILSHNVFLIN